jgi:hypothetical protein
MNGKFYRRRPGEGHSSDELKIRSNSLLLLNIRGWRRSAEDRNI